MKRYSSIFAIIALIILQAISAAGQTAGNQTRTQADESARKIAINSLPAPAKRYALIIGIDKYEDPKITALSGGTNDARALADALKKYAGFPEDQIILLTTDQAPERQPKRNTIIELLSNLANAARKDNGLLLVSFAGHGIERGNRPFLLSCDARLGNDNDLDLLEDTAVSVSRMKERIKGLDQVIMILDACRNDPSASRSAGENTLSDTFRRSFNFDVRNREVKAFATLYAALPGEISYEYRDKRQGFFTWALVEALKGNVPEVANEKGEITLGRLVKYLEERVPKLVSLNTGKQQKPHLVYDGYRSDELVVAIINPAAKTDLSNEQELRFWDSVKQSNSAEVLKTYLDKYPNGEFAAVASARIKDLQSSPKRVLTMDNFSPASTPTPSQAEQSFWDSIKNSNNPADFQAYLNKFPSGFYAELARNKVSGVASASNSQPSRNYPPQPDSSRATKTNLDINGTWQELDGYCNGSTIQINLSGNYLTVSGEKRCQGGENLQWTATKTAVKESNHIGYVMNFNGMEVASEVTFISDTEATKVYRTSKGSNGTVHMKKISR